MNNTEDAVWIDQMDLIIHDRYRLHHSIIPYNGYPFQNDTIPIDIRPDKNNYYIKTMLFIESKKAENLTFDLRRPHSHNFNEFIVFDIKINSNHKNLTTDKIIDFIGHDPIHLLKDEEPQYDGKVAYNKELVNNVNNSRMPKSNRARKFIENYSKNAEMN